MATTKGNFCAKICTKFDDCSPDELCMAAPGGYEGNICREEWPVVCAPCTSNSYCLGWQYWSYCIGDAATGWFCGAGCNISADCPANYECAQRKSIDGQSINQCVPAGGKECACSEYAVTNQLHTSCLNGTCKGTRSCGPNGLTACSAPSPATETCNDLDDDCNGLTDDGIGCK